MPLALIGSVLYENEAARDAAGVWQIVATLNLTSPTHTKATGKNKHL